MHDFVPATLGPQKLQGVLSGAAFFFCLLFIASSVCEFPNFQNVSILWRMATIASDVSDLDREQAAIVSDG